jgi:esterase
MLYVVLHSGRGIVVVDNRDENGMTVSLAATEYGEGPPVAVLHGLFGSGHNWAGMAQRLARRHRVIAFDLRNHGASPWAEPMGYAEMAADVEGAMQAREHRRYALIGHSLGGKVAMLMALSDGAAIERVVVVDIAPAAYPETHAAYARAMRGLDLAAIRRRGDADALLAEAIPDPAERGFLLQNLILGEGPPRWRANLAAIEAALPALAGFPGLRAGAVYRGPALFVAGAQSDYLRGEHEPAIRRLFPGAEIARITDAGHWVHADQPDAFLAVVEPFLAA